MFGKRKSTIVSDLEPDTRGIAIKLFIENQTQDFFANTDRSEFISTGTLYSELLSAVYQGKFDEFITTHNLTEQANQGPIDGNATNILKKYYFQSGSLAFGPSAFVFRLRPCDYNMQMVDKDLTSLNLLRENLKASMKTAFLNKKELCFNFDMQLFRDEKTTPIENPTIPWDTEFHQVAKVIIHTNSSNIFKSFLPDQDDFCRWLSFNAWNYVKGHRPLGWMNRVRKGVYSDGAEQRHAFNGINRSEVTLKDWQNFPESVNIYNR